MDELLPAQLRDAIRSGDFGMAGVLSTQYSKSVTDQLRVAGSQEAAQKIARDSLEVLQECLYLAQVMRAHIAKKLHTNRSVCLYAAKRDAPSIWGIEA
ncbi:MAG: hypothetical protein JOY54_20250 [Acidobacteriaceae bacterium]|nr:hypothetical protein [Acidobacteriaceae bacterium]